MAVGNLQFCIVNRGLIVFDCSLEFVGGSLLGIYLLLRDCAGFLKESLITFQNRFRVAQGRLIFKQCCLSLAQLHFKRTRINHCEQLTLFYVLPFFEFHIFKLPVHAAFYVDGIKGGNGAEAGEVIRHVAALRGSNANWHGLRPCWPGRGGF